MNSSKSPVNGHHGHSNQKPLSNNQLKLLKAREWRKKVKQNAGQASSEGSNMKNHAQYNHSPTNNSSSSSSVSLVKQSSTTGLTRHLAIDCEMVGVGYRGCRDILARVSIVNAFGHVVYDKYVLPSEPVTDYRTFVSGILPHHLEKGIQFSKCQREVCDLLHDRILIGHAVHHDLKVLYLEHPTSDIRDTSKYFDSSAYGGRGTPSLRKLTEYYLGVDIQSAAHDSVEDARATMRLYTLFKKDWESSLQKSRKKSNSRTAETAGKDTQENHKSSFLGF